VVQRVNCAQGKLPAHKMLEGSGKLRRHIKLTTLQDIADKHVHVYLALALQAAAKA